jgi:hypothetical protein
LVPVAPSAKIQSRFASSVWSGEEGAELMEPPYCLKSSLI